MSLTLTKVSETSSTITLGWTPPANVGGYVFYANGQVSLGGDGNPAFTSSAAGNPAMTMPRGGLPVRTLPWGALIGRVGAGQPFAIGGNSSAVTMPAAGRLYLGVNDAAFDDNSGAFSVTAVR